MVFGGKSAPSIQVAGLHGAHSTCSWETGHHMFFHEERMWGQKEVGVPENMAGSGFPRMCWAAESAGCLCWITRQGLSGEPKCFQGLAWPCHWL